MARPLKYDKQEVMNFICDRIAEGESLRAICQDEALPAIKTIMEWLVHDKELSEQYARAREMQADYYVEQIIDISDNSGKDIVVTKDGIEKVDNEAIQRDRLRVDSRKWVASKLAPKKYGDNLKLEHSGEVNFEREVIIKTAE